MAKHGLPFFFLIFAIIVPVADSVLSAIVERLIRANLINPSLNDDTIGLVTLGASIVLYVIVYRILNKLELVEEKRLDEVEH